jgi:hypothetical protein
LYAKNRQQNIFHPHFYSWFTVEITQVLFFCLIQNNFSVAAKTNQEMLNKNDGVCVDFLPEFLPTPDRY